MASDTVDAATEWLIHALEQERHRNVLWFLDENTTTMPANINANALTIIGNRWDGAERARLSGLTALFNDFEESTVPPGTMERVYCRVSKEKPVVHHLINFAGRSLKPGGELILCGHKSEGIKTYITKAARYLGAPEKGQKQGELYTARLTRSGSLDSPLPDGDYASLRPIAEYQDLTLSSKPGLYGWQKIDRGSERLWEQAEPILQQKPPTSLLDLGCGYGYLGLMTKHLPIQRRVMTDNNAAAITAARLNVEQNKINAEVIADDCARHIHERFDVVLCNPPFHQGFTVSGDLTDRFLQSAREHLTPQGIALFVVNRFIPLERKAQSLFSHADLLSDADGFKVFKLTP